MLPLGSSQAGSVSKEGRHDGASPLGDRKTNEHWVVVKDSIMLETVLQDAAG